MPVFDRKTYGVSASPPAFVSKDNRGGGALIRVHTHGRQCAGMTSGACPSLLGLKTSTDGQGSRNRVGRVSEASLRFSSPGVGLLLP